MRDTGSDAGAIQRVQQVKAVFHCYKEIFGRPQHQNAAADNDRCPQHHIHPDWRIEGISNGDGEGDDRRAKHQDGQNHRPIARVLVCETEPARRAMPRDRQEPVMELSLVLSYRGKGQVKAAVRDETGR